MEDLLISRNLQYLSWSLCWDTLPGMFSQSPLTHHSGYDLIRTFTTPTKCKPRLDSVFVQFMTFFSRPKQFLTCYKSPRPAGSVFRSKEHTGKQPLEWGLQAWLPSIPAPPLTLGSTKHYHLKALHLGCHRPEMLVGKQPCASMVFVGQCWKVLVLSEHVSSVCDFGGYFLTLS